MRALPVALVLALFIFPAIPGGHVSDIDPFHPPFTATILADPLGPMDLYGHTVAWAAERQGTIHLLLTDLRDGTESTVTQFPSSNHPVPVQSLAFDGRWVAWTDTRFGNMEAFAADTQTGELLRLSDHRLDDRDIDVSEGRFTWTRTGVMYSESDGVATAIPGTGVSFTPRFAGDWIIWSQVDGNKRILQAHHLPSNATQTLANEEGIVQKELAGSEDGQVVWSSADDPMTTIHTLRLHPDGTVGATRTLEGEYGPYESPTAGGGHVAWMEHLGGIARLHVADVDDLHDGTAAAVLPPMMSDALLVLPYPDAEGLSLQSITWNEWDSLVPDEPRDPRPILYAAGAVLLVGGGLMGWIRARKK